MNNRNKAHEIFGNEAVYEKCSLDFDSMEETTSKTNIGKKFNETIQTLKLAQNRIIQTVEQSCRNLLTAKHKLASQMFKEALMGF